MSQFCADIKGFSVSSDLLSPGEPEDEPPAPPSGPKRVSEATLKEPDHKF